MKFNLNYKYKYNNLKIKLIKHKFKKCQETIIRTYQTIPFKKT